MENNSNYLIQITEKILNPKIPLHLLSHEINSLRQFIEERAPFQIIPHQNISEGETYLDSGLGISPTQAALCAFEIVRTAAFIRGLGEAIQYFRLTCSYRATQVLYAGCGPYALLAFPLMSIFTPENVRFTLLDVHEESIHSAKTLVDSSGFSNHVTACICVDAMRYQISPHEKPDIIVSETMNTGLSTEPQVNIIRHLFTQAPSAILVPQSVCIDACLLAPSKEHLHFPEDHVDEFPLPNRDRINLGTVFELNADNMNKWKDKRSDRLPAARIELPSFFHQRYSPKLLTIVNVFGDIILKDYDCSLTIPIDFPIQDTLSGGEVLQFEYCLDDIPGLSCEIIQMEK